VQTSLTPAARRARLMGFVRICQLGRGLPGQPADGCMVDSVALGDSLGLSSGMARELRKHVAILEREIAELRRRPGSFQPLPSMFATSPEPGEDSTNPAWASSARLREEEGQAGYDPFKD
jgi:hypothetical protein